MSARVRVAYVNFRVGFLCPGGDVDRKTAKIVGRTYLKIIAQQAPEEAPEGSDDPNYGGKGAFNLPADHVAAMEVPKGGACCEKCVYVDAENHQCLEPNYIEWNGGDPKLPDLPLDQICSDWFKAG